MLAASESASDIDLLGNREVHLAHDWSSRVGRYADLVSGGRHYWKDLQQGHHLVKMEINKLSLAAYYDPSEFPPS